MRIPNATFRVLFTFILLMGVTSCLGVVRYREPNPDGFSGSAMVRSEDHQTVYVSAQLPVDDGGELIGPGDLERQTAQVFLNIEQQLDLNNGDLDDLVSITCYLTDLERMDAFYRGRDRMIDTINPPTFTIVPVERLPGKGMVMISAVAVVSDF